jgi:hypothetical protein
MKRAVIFLCLFMICQIQTSADNPKSPSFSSFFMHHFIGPLNVQQQISAFSEGSFCGSYCGLQSICEVKENDSIKSIPIKFFLNPFIRNSASLILMTQLHLGVTNGKSAFIATRSAGWAVGMVMSTALLKMVVK